MGAMVQAGRAVVLQQQWVAVELHCSNAAEWQPIAAAVHLTLPVAPDADTAAHGV